MKPMFNRWLFLFLSFFSLHRLQAQGDIIRQQDCIQASFLPQIDSIKQNMNAQGFALVREASMAMESEYEMPVIVPLNQGSWYHFVFIGDPTSKLYEVRMYDSDDRQVFYQKHQWGDVDGNIISYTYVPKFSQYHMLKPVQVNKVRKKGLCGYVMMFKKVANPG